MKKIFAICVLTFGALSMSSCLNYDEPGDELEPNQQLYQYTPSETADDNGGEAGGETGGQE